MKTAGYSGTSLAKKLGIKEGQKIAFINMPEHYFELFSDMPSITIIKDRKKKRDLIHYFVKEQKQLVKDILVLKESIEQKALSGSRGPKKPLVLTPTLPRIQ